MNLLLCGEIGCGKSTLIRNALGEDARSAGGFVTLRLLDGDTLLGFELAEASALAEPSAKRERFLDFSKKPPQNNHAFAGFGAELLREALDAPFAVADEFGGLELLIPEFREALMALLRSPVPVIGVLKAPRASRSLAARIPLDSSYPQAYDALYELLRQDPNTRILDTTGRYDRQAEEAVRDWAAQYVRK